MYRSAKDIITDIVRTGALPLLKAAGFKKASLVFHRRLSEVAQVVGFQLSQGNFADSGRFYVNVGVAFDRLWQLDNTLVVDRPQAHVCHFYTRLEELVTTARPTWDVSATTDIDAMAIELRQAIQPLIEILDSIDSPDALLSTNLLQTGSQVILRARLFYVCGELDAALRDVLTAAQYFSDRQGMSPLQIISREGLKDLEQLIKA